jgi:hypothetical protein
MDQRSDKISYPHDQEIQDEEKDDENAESDIDAMDLITRQATVRTKSCKKTVEQFFL